MKRSRLKKLTLGLASAALGLGLWCEQPAWARIKLITLPVRERVEIQLDHATATLVEEERLVPLIKGVNQVDFSWANTAIDPSTILFRVLPPADAAAQPNKIELLSVSYPPGENALIWQVSAAESGSARVRISYLLGNLNKSFSYRAVADRNEKVLTFSQYIRVQNLANESFGATGLWAGFGPRFLKPIGLNETKEMLMEQAAGIPIVKTYTCNVAEYGYLDEPQKKLKVPMHYLIKNDAASQLGKAPIQAGKVRIFQQDAQGTTAFLGEDWGRFTPIDDEMKLYLGVAQDIVVKRTIERNQRQRVTGNLYHADIVIKYTIENFKDQAVQLDIIEPIPMIRAELLGLGAERGAQWESGPQTTLPGGLDKEKTTFDTAVFHVPLPAKGADGKAPKQEFLFHLVLKNEW